MKKPAILLAVSNEAIRQSARGVLLCHGCEVIESSGDSCDLRCLRNGRPDLVIIEPTPDAPGREVEAARKIRQVDREVSLILITGNSSEELAIAALRAGVNDYFKYPFKPEELAAALRRCLPQSFSREVLAGQGATAPHPVDSPWMIGESQAIREIRAYIGRLAQTDVNVLITGETGTGKELAAELIHRGSPRHQRPFVCINCTAIPESLLESELFGHERGAFTGAHALKEGRLKLADGGTTLLDEVGDMAPEGQVKILRVIESKEVHRLGGRRGISLDVRFIAATNQDLEQRVTEGKFRKDLYFRLNVARVHLPPLRERREDIPPLIDHTIRHLNRRFGREVEGFTEETLDSLLRYDWPGNVRELKNLGEAIFVNQPSRQISLRDIPAPFRQRLLEAESLPRDERDRLLSTLVSTNWNKSKAAQKLQWSRMTLYRKMAKYQIDGAGMEVKDERR
jgi:DNA-binding NtrC family response regulator